MAVARDVDARELRRAGPGAARDSSASDGVAPVRSRGAPATGARRVGRVAQRAVPGQHRGAGHAGPGSGGARPRSPGRRCRRARCPSSAARRGGRAAACVDVQVGHQPGRIAGARRRLAQEVAAGSPPRARPRTPAARRCTAPACQRSSVWVATSQRIHLDAVPPVCDAQHHAAGAQPRRPQRRGQSAREPGVALGPGQHAVALAARRRPARGSRGGWRSSGCRPRPRRWPGPRRSRRGSSSPGTSAGAGRSGPRGPARPAKVMASSARWRGGRRRREGRHRKAALACCGGAHALRQSAGTAPAWRRPRPAPAAGRPASRR